MSYDDNNIFARILRGELPSVRVYENDVVFAFMDVMPRSDGHTLVIPKAPVRNILDASPQHLADCMEAVKLLSEAMLASSLDAQGITLLQSNESAGDQEVFHLHFHVVPRYEGQRLRRPTGEMEKPEVLEAHAQKVRVALGQ
ncbi:MAG: histidine triad (HIT) family protein [Gammaproteobacteria bacterium]|jgi:histidine triad (HIT) family protein